MSESPPKVTRRNDDKPPNEDEPKLDKCKLSLSLSENTLDSQKGIRHKILGKVKSWSSKDLHSKDKSISVELDLARSLTKLEVVESNENLGSNLLRARDSLDNLVKDEQNMPKSSLERSVVHSRRKNMPDSPKSSPQLGENWKASTSKLSYWDPYDRQAKKNRKDIKKKNKNKDSPRNDNARPDNDKTSKETEKNPDETMTNEEASVIEEEGGQKYHKYLAKNSKSVVFTNEVLVVYFNNDDVVGEEKEPLKKEIEQQTRNKEMRRVHLNKTQEKNNLCLF